MSVSASTPGSAPNSPSGSVSSATEESAPKASLKSRSLKGGAWAMGGFGASKGLRLASNLILARFLAPEAFAVATIAVALLVWLDMICDLGVNSSVMREKEGETPAFLRTAWTIQMIRNGLIATCLWLVALALPWFAGAGLVADHSVFADPLLPSVVAIVGLCVLVDGARSMGLALCQRRMQFHRIVRLELSSQIIASIVTVGLAMIGFGVYALVLGMLTNSVLMATGSHLFLGAPAPRFALTPTHRRAIINYGKWIILASTLGFLVSRGDQIIFGGLVPNDMFGVYAVATIWLMTLRALFSVVLSTVAYPMFSELGRDKPEARTRIYYKLRLMLDAAAFAVFVGIYFFAEPVFAILYPEAFSGVSDYVRLLSVGALLLPYNLLNTVLLCAGDSKRFSGAVAVPGVVMFFGLPTVYHLFGFEIAIICAALVNLFALPFLYWFVRRHIALRLVNEAALLLMMPLAAVLALEAVTLG